MLIVDINIRGDKMDKYKIILLDDHKMVVSSIASELEEEPDMCIQKVLTNPGELDANIQTYKPDLIIMDIRMGKYNGIHLTKEIKKKYPDLKVILISGYNLCYLAKDCGADAFSSKEDSIESLVSTIRKIMEDDVLIFSKKAMGDKILTKAETNVLQLISEDKTRKEIAKELYVSEKTVTNHITSINRKLEVRSRTGAIVKGFELGLIN